MGFREQFGTEGRRKKEILNETKKMIDAESINKPTVKKVEITLKKKLLILDYLGISQRLNMDNTKKAKLLSVLLNQSEQNIREYFSDKNIREKEIKTKENLNYILTLFDELNLEDYKIQVINDIEKYVKKE